MRDGKRSFTKFLANFPLGLLLGAVFALFLAQIIDATVKESLQKNWTYLFAFGGSLIASIVAVTGILANINNQNILSERQRQENLAASQAVLPLALTRLVEISEKGFELAYTNIDFLRETDNSRKASQELSLNKEVLDIIKDCIRFSDEPARDWLCLLVSHYQVYRSRTMNRINDSNMLSSELNKASQAADWILLKAICEHLFDYSRGSRSVAEHLDPNRISAPLEYLDIVSQHQTELVAALARTRNFYTPYHHSNFKFSNLKPFLEDL